MIRMSLEKGMISTRQVIFLTTNVILSTLVLFIPAFLAKEVGQDAWMTIPIAGGVGLIDGFLFLTLGLRFPDKNLVEYSVDLLGPWLGRALGILFGLYALYVGAVIIREFGELLVTEVMPSTPLVVLSALLVALAAYGVYLGLEVIARVNEIVFPLAIIALFIVFLFALPEMEFHQLEPVLTHSFASLFKTSASLWSFFAEGTIFLMFIPNLRKQGEAFKRFIPAVVVLLVVILTVDVAGVIALMGAPETSRLIFPIYELAKTVHLGGFIERIESLVVGIWVSTVGLKLMVIYLAAVLAFAQSFNLRDYRPLVLPSGVILVALSILVFTDIVQVRSFLFQYWPAMSISFSTGLILLLWAVALLRKKDGRKREVQPALENNG